MEKYFDTVTTKYTAKQFLSWDEIIFNGRRCKISPLENFGMGAEVNHHRIAVVYSGKGSVELSLIHSMSPDIRAALNSRSRYTLFRPAKSGVVQHISVPERGERCVWLAARVVGDVKVRAIGHACWRGRNTLYGHLPRTFTFAGAKLPYRLMYPWNYDSSKSYPLVLSISGSGGMGSDNRRNMEDVILARYLFVNYYGDKDFECFSVVPQIPSPDAILPAPYWSSKRSDGLGRPSYPYHPDWPTVNEKGWYVRATLAMLQDLMKDKRYNIDPDRIYLTGFSYGGKACWEFLKDGRKVFAGAMVGAGWPIGQARSNPSAALLDRLRLEVRRYKHIPVSIFVGQRDRMRFGSQAVHKEIVAQGGNSTYVEIPGADHVGSAVSIWAKRRNIEWLFSQNRKKNPSPGPDPFPDGNYSK
ncbi:MAG: hypothetical protein J7M14_06405 [Planctomycetes bacterium]|nr:hypothetical protein [Planctomycetota bacterium]